MAIYAARTSLAGERRSAGKSYRRRTGTRRISRIFEQGLKKTVGYALPIERRLGQQGLMWASGRWFLRREHLFLFPGDSAMGFRLPLDSLPWVAPEDRDALVARDPYAELAPFPPRETLIRRQERDATEQAAPAYTGIANGYVATNGHAENGSGHHTDRLPVEIGAAAGDYADAQSRAAIAERGGHSDGGYGSGFGGDADAGAFETPKPKFQKPARSTDRPWYVKVEDGFPAPSVPPYPQQSSPWIVRTAMCFESREGRLHIFMPPLQTADDYLELVAHIEETAAELNTPVVIEGYHPPHDPRLTNLKVTPDPGVIEVNMQPASSWDELVDITTGLYEDARQIRLGCDKFMLDGRHTGTGGGNHIVMGGATPAESPFLRRPDLLRSLLAYWNNHPSLSYLLSGLFIGPTSQAPRIDEGRHEQLYELGIAFQQMPESGHTPPWLVDRLFRHLLTDMTGNTHRAEFCIDKLYSPDSSTGRLGLIEFRAFEMPPHSRMSLAQQLLLRALTMKFWREPYQGSLVHWGTRIHDKFMLPYYIQQDFRDVVNDLRASGYELDLEWFKPHFDFRFPLYGDVVRDGVKLELRCALEPWLVMGEEGMVGGTARYVDSSLERVQTLVKNFLPERHVLTVNRRRVPLHPTGIAGEYVAGVRYRAWQPPSCLHPTIGVHTPLTFDVYDTWTKRSLGGCQWHVMHPGGRSYETYPINANEAEARRAAVFYDQSLARRVVRTADRNQRAVPDDARPALSRGLKSGFHEVGQEVLSTAQSEPFTTDVRTPFEPP
ncbi:MAG: transglutaminase family protein [Pirellulales bacterium]